MVKINPCMLIVPQEKTAEPALSTATLETSDPYDLYIGREIAVSFYFLLLYNCKCLVVHPGKFLKLPSRVGLIQTLKEKNNPTE